MAEETKTEGKTEEKLLTQAQVDAIIQDRLAREKAKFADYPDLKKKVEEYEKSQDEKQLKILEEQRKYEEATKITNAKVAEYQGLLSKKDQEIQDMRISNALVGEINNQNAYAEETMALLKSSAVIKDGHVVIKGRDSNGIEKDYSVAEGVKNFLTQRPHLIKVINRNGAGTTSGQGSTGSVSGAEGQDRSVLQKELLDAHRRGDVKKVGELTSKIRARLTP